MNQGMKIMAGLANSRLPRCRKAAGRVASGMGKFIGERMGRKGCADHRKV